MGGGGGGGGEGFAVKAGTQRALESAVNKVLRDSCLL